MPMAAMNMKRARMVTADSVKWLSNVQSCEKENRWLLFLRGYAEATGYKEGDSPSIELFELFVTYSFYVHRSSGSRIVCP